MTRSRLLGLQRFLRLVSEGRAGELESDFAEIARLLPDDPQASAHARALLNAHGGQPAEARLRASGAHRHLVQLHTPEHRIDWRQ